MWRIVAVVIQTIRDSLHLQRCLLASRARKIRRLLAARRPSARETITRIDLQPNAYFHVYWKRVAEMGQGPCVSLYIFDDEVLKFDCFGSGTGHFHVNLIQSSYATSYLETRLRFSEESIKSQIDRALFEIRVNGTYYLQRSWDSRIARVSLDRVRLELVTEEIKQHMLDALQEKLPPLPDPGLSAEVPDNKRLAG